jgi:hypothetical protein
MLEVKNISFEVEDAETGPRLSIISVLRSNPGNFLLSPARTEAENRRWPKSLWASKSQLQSDFV